MNPNAAERAHILILDDNPADARLAILKLEDAGFAIDGEVAGNRAVFMERVNSNTYDAILCDFSIPGWSGKDALRWVRTSDKEIPFIFVSGTLGEESAVDCIKEGATDYVLKGNLERLPVAVRRALSDKKLQDLNGQLVQRLLRGSAELELSNRLLQSEIEEREKTEQELRQVQRLDAIGRLAAGVAHDFNNLLAVILGQSELLLMQSKEAADTRRIEVIQKSVHRGAALTRQLLAFGGKQVLKPEVLNFNTVLADVDRLLRLGIGESIELEMQMEPALGSVEGDAGQLEQAILNLALNARDAMPAGGRLTITTANLQLDEAFVDHRVVIKPGRYVQIVVQDTGCGMDEATQARIFEPFFTTKAKDKGTGLGLATVYGIVKQSGGYIWVYSEPGHGTAFKIYLPMVDAAPGRLRPIEPINTLAPRGYETILLVEDDLFLQSVTCDFLKISGYTVLPAGTPDEALVLAKSYNGPIDFILTDMMMPRMNGRELAIQLHAILPQAKVLYVSGYSDDFMNVGRQVMEKGLPFLQKPYTRLALTQKIREILDSD